LLPENKLKPGTGAQVVVGRLLHETCWLHVSLKKIISVLKIHLFNMMLTVLCVS